MVKLKTTTLWWVIAAVVLFTTPLLLIESPKAIEPIKPRSTLEVTTSATPVNTEITGREATLENKGLQISQYLAGKWEIEAVIPTSNMQAEANMGNIGVEVEYAAGKATIGQVTVLNTQYIVSEITATDLEDGWRGLKAAELKITRKPITQIDIVSESGYIGGVGTHLLVRDENTMLTDWDGVFYKMVRK